MISDDELLRLAHEVPPDAGRGRIARLYPHLSRSDIDRVIGARQMLRVMTPVRTVAGRTGAMLEKEAPVTTAEQLVRISNIDTDDFYQVDEVQPNAWMGQKKGGELVQLYQVKVKFRRKLKSLVRPPQGPPVPYAEPRDLQGVQTLLALPDSQHGFRRVGNRLVPMHDRRALHVAEQLALYINPDFLVDLGDGLDLPTLSKYLQEPETRGLIEPAIWSKHWQLRQLSRAVPRARRVYKGSNHDDRLHKRISELLADLAGLRPAGTARPALSIEHLLQLEEIGWEMPDGGMHGAESWFFDGNLRVTHGDSAAKNAAEIHWAATHSTIFGHVHRHVTHAAWAHHAGESRYRVAMSPGCLCRVDDMGPPPKGRKTGWSQGVAVARYSGGKVWIQHIPIIDGCAIYDGKIFVGSDREEELTAWYESN